MEDNYYFSPTSLNGMTNKANKAIDEMREKSYDFCTPWQTTSHIMNGK